MPDMSWNDANRTAQAADIAHGEKTLAELQPLKTAADAAAAPQARPTQIDKLMTRPEIPSLPPEYAKLQPPTIPEFTPKYHPDLPTIPPAAISADAKIAQGMEQLRPQTMPPSAFTQEGTPTIPPQAISSEAQALPGLEKSRSGMLPPSTEEALDQSLIGGLPEQPAPIEYSGKYETDFGPTASSAPESPAAYVVRGAEQDALRKQARGLPPGPPQPKADRPGEDIFAADQASARSKSHAPTEIEGYAPKHRSQRPSDLYSDFPEGHSQYGNKAFGGEFDLDASDTKSPTSAGTPKGTKVSDLMKKKTKRARDDD
jgi:hypothetical protein